MHRVGERLEGLAKKKGDSNVKNPETGKFYNYLDLYKKSDTGKNIKDIGSNFEDFANGKIDYDSMSEDDQKKYRKYLENIVDSTIMDAQRAMATPPSMEIGGYQEIGEIIPTKELMDKRVKNRTVNRSNLGLTINAITTLEGTDLTQRDREKIIKSLKNYLKQARKHSETHNKDNIEFNTELKDIESESKSISNYDATRLNEYKERIQHLLGTVEAK
ncbi:hypothetical protein COU23_00710 [Candidatus Kuenenbacteria bacterium CG10_big_fil_rev_8_21_14_0_10_36_11]|uniref:Uncharacterized protein n=1 Tax=Candidatus Kuenenbacteria bacterium CG10_big_fil_rev_8_21_14_0_10_36_11 TaxID=1974618 RepID=A0A2M6WB66_9BACT|nr:MAG: hypothetical protein COU23_00710 [Candidatus Kuenenbacteria bacterium CG10_big_fil_rev_8_21_14_0_10_36_11]